jgi:hypothetical protein
MTDNVRPLPEDAEKARRLAERQRADLHKGSGGGTSGGMEDRVTRLETHFEYVRRDLDDIKSSLKTMNERLTDLPTKADLATFKWQWIALAMALAALVVGAVVGALSWIATITVAP